VCVLLPIFFVGAQAQSKSQTDQQIINIIHKYRPLIGTRIPSDISDMLGATHVGGKYYFTKEPYIIEGSRKLSDLGFGVLKLWFSKVPQGGYPYNSKWNVKSNITLNQLAQHPYYAACFNLPFSTFVLSVSGAGIKTTEATAKEEGEEIYQLAKYLLEKYHNRKITFIIENWEGDWMLRGGTGDDARWSRKINNPIHAEDGLFHTVPVPADSMQRVNAMIKWFQARQEGIDRARNEVKETKCKIFNAIEANKVYDSMNGIPGIANYVLPKVHVDMVSWSSYDGLTANGVDLYKGIEYLKKQMYPTAYMKGKRVVFLGEIGIPEQSSGLTRKEIIQRWDTYLGVCLALRVPYMIQWELYCNEPKNEALRHSIEPRKTNEMRGFWLIRPDGTEGYAEQYFSQLLKYAGKQIPEEIRLNLQKNNQLNE
jgi:hypothetical protein